MFKTDIIVEVRTTSNRLPGKAIKKIINRPVIELMIERLKRISNVQDIIIATTVNTDDDVIEKISNKNKVKCFRGSENDVLGRVLLAANKYNTDIIVEITGDNPLIDPHISELIIEFFIKNNLKYDYVSNDVGCYDNKISFNLALGLNVKIFKTSLLKKVSELTINPVDREHVVNYILQNSDKYKIHNYEVEKVYQRPDLRFTLDYQEDFELIRHVYENLYLKKNDFNAKDIIGFLDDNPKIKQLNHKCIQNQYTY
jgi:spore coat polysaccharide biosynthesis protein SpsF